MFEASSRLAVRFLLDTHVVIRWISDTKKVSRDQIRVLEASVSRNEPLAISAISLLEIAVLPEVGRYKQERDKLLHLVETNPVFTVLPLSFEIATEIVALGPGLRDPADRAIVATARVHRLRLVTSDERIINSKLVQTIE